ncbi:MAG: YIP1 family protein [Anaerolineales bacterium]|nr:YIP1 family protein [Anaerolineales bacterium]
MKREFARVTGLTARIAYCVLRIATLIRNTQYATRAIILLFLLLLLGLASTPAHAQTPYATWAWGPNGWLVMTQDAYTPYAEIDLPISGAEDMFITADGTIYVADTGNGRILKLDNFEVAASYGQDVLAGPTGLFVAEDGTMYVADARQDRIVILDAAGGVVNQFGRPTEPLFGQNREFLPRKIAVDARENLYVISEGSVNGIVQMHTNGSFIGYYGANSASMSLQMLLRRMFLTEEQLDQFIRNEAASPSNLTIDHQSLVFTITAGTSEWEAIRRFTISGKNIFPDTLGSTAFRDIDVSANGLVLAVAADSVIFEYDLNGALLFVFGAQDSGDQRLGTLRNPTAIARHGEFIYVLDKDKNALVVYQTTAFARQVHDGVQLYVEGFYEEARPYFEAVLDANGSFIMAYQAIADAHFKAQAYETALANYRYAEDREGYSQAFWELRNVVLQRFLGQALMALFGLTLVYQTVNRFERRYRWFDPLRRWLKARQANRLVDDFVFMFRFIRRPADSFYYIKKDLRGSVAFASLIYLAVIAIRVLSLYVTGFTFNRYSYLADIRVANEIVTTGLLLLLWNAANYLVSTISDGEGRIRDVYMGTAYSLFPYLLIALPVALISNVLTLNETFLYTFSLNLMFVWIGIMLVIMVKEIHNYSFSETVRNILLTLFTMALLVLTGYILYVLFNQLFDFITAIAQELRLRA